MAKLFYGILLAAAFVFGRLTAPVAEMRHVRETVFRIDTVRVVQPEVIVIHSREPVKEKLAVAESDDSVEVLVPVEQRVYTGPEYKAFVSGHMPRLDSIEIYRPVTVVQQPKKDRRLSIGLQAGYGLTPAGLQPYVGLGLSIRIL